jgi:ABC-2 type transport system ATP-binding protein
MNKIVLQTHNLSKQYGRVTAVDQVNLTIYEGEVFGFLGPNGAGKTTTIGMALGLVEPTAGRVEIFGRPISSRQPAALRQVGALVGAPALVPYLSGRDNLRLLARLHPDVDTPRIAAMLEMVGMSKAADRPTSDYSTGMKQRLGLAAAMLHRPSLIILDEPTNGLDPAGMREVRELLRRLASEGITVFLSSHLLNEVEQVCDRIAVLSHGRVVAQGNVNDLLNNEQTAVKVRVASPAAAHEALQSLAGVTKVESNGVYIRVSGVAGESVVAHLVNQGIIPGEVTTERTNLEDMFLQLTKD